MKIAILDPFHSGSHRAWSTGLARHSDHEIRIFSLPGRHWKWRMHGAALSLAKAWTSSGFAADMILTTDMMALDTFAALCRHSLNHVNLAIYFHENQLTYPWSPDDPDTITGRDNHYAFINLTSALAADRLFFNSKYHLESFLGALPEFCRQFPPPSIQPEAETLRDKSAVLPPGIDLKSLDHPVPEKRLNPVILWNHRWEYDKGPEAFLRPYFNWTAKAWISNSLYSVRLTGSRPRFSLMPAQSSLTKFSTGALPPADSNMPNSCDNQTSCLSQAGKTFSAYQS